MDSALLTQLRTVAPEDNSIFHRGAPRSTDGADPVVASDTQYVKVGERT